MDNQDKQFTEYTWNADDYQNEVTTVFAEVRPVEKAKAKKPRGGIMKYTISAICGMLAGALIFAGAATYTGSLNNNQSAYAPPALTQSITPTATPSYVIQRDDADPVVSADTTALLPQEMSVEEIAEQVGPAIVGITIRRTGQSFFGQTQTVEGGGSGIIIKADGYIVTNEHVVTDAEDVVVILKNGKEYPAKVVGTDKSTDIAILKIEAEGLVAAQLGQSSALRVGEMAVAIGNPIGLKFANTVTCGVISALDRQLEVGGVNYKLIQTDAHINYGNSGGALINKYGQVIGINTMKGGTGTEGLSFAIPIDDVIPIADSLMQNGYVAGRPAKLGISPQQINTATAIRYNIPVGLYIVEIEPNSAAAKAGMVADEVIIKADGKDIKTKAELDEIRDSHAIGESFDIVTEHPDTGEQKTYTVTIQEERN